MEKAVSYYGFAENDFQFLRDNVEDGRVSNAMCVMAQNICERYLKAVMEETLPDMDNTNIMKTHSLKRLKSYICEHVPDFECDWKTVIQADGYYFSARYPGEESFFVTDIDVKECWQSVREAKRATDSYLCHKRREVNRSENDLRECVEMTGRKMNAKR